MSTSTPTGLINSAPAADSERFDVVVVGACITDFISYVPHIPSIGETLRGHGFENGFGGKGANQCVAAARMGSKTALIAKLGSDFWGEQYRENLEVNNIYTKHVDTVEGQTTGIAQITVSDNGDNQIIIIPGANDTLCPEDIENAKDIIDNGKVLICQLETPLKSSLTALRRFKGISILNASPAPTETTLELFTLPSILCINEVEAASMTKRHVPNIEEAKRAVSNFMCLGCPTVVLTLGRQGAIFATNSNPKPIHVRTPKIKNAIDTTGAGDAFTGVLAHFLATRPDVPLLQMVGAAVEIATMSVQKRGTQSSYPTLKELNEFDIKTKVFDWSYA